MRLIDADALMMHLADIKIAYNPDECESWYLRERALAVCVGIDKAMDAVKEAPTVNVCDRGKYKPNKLKPPSDRWLHPTTYLCGFCGKITHGKYCSNCGCENDWSDYLAARAAVSKETYEAIDHIIKQMKERRHDTDSADSDVSP